MAETLKDRIRREKRSGKTAIEIQRVLRDENLEVPWIETKTIFNNLSDEEANR